MLTVLNKSIARSDGLLWIVNKWWYDFLSYTHKDKEIVDVIAQKLSVVFGQDAIFFDAWSIQPCDSIVAKMYPNEYIEAAEINKSTYSKEAYTHFLDYLEAERDDQILFRSFLRFWTFCTCIW